MSKADEKQIETEGVAIQNNTLGYDQIALRSFPLASGISRNARRFGERVTIDRAIQNSIENDSLLIPELFQWPT
jgi:hypothetical protein